MLVQAALPLTEEAGPSSGSQGGLGSVFFSCLSGRHFSVLYLKSL